MQVFPERVYDVGIAEQHAVTFAAGLACEGLAPFVAIYSSFLQRGYDQVVHDVSLQNLPGALCCIRICSLACNMPSCQNACLPLCAWQAQGTTCHCVLRAMINRRRVGQTHPRAFSLLCSAFCYGPRWPGGRRRCHTLRRF